MRLSVSHSFLPKRPSVRAAVVMDHFGVGFEQGRHVIADGLELPLQPGQIVLFSGASGSGKSSLMRAAVETLASERDPSLSEPALIVLEALELADRILIDSLGLPAADGMNLLSACGLGEAHLMLRTPAELSDGQRYRYRLALALARKPRWVVADEFTAALDRTLAKVIAFNLRRLSRRTGTGFLLATTHTDILEDLCPDLLVTCRLDGETTVTAFAAGNRIVTTCRTPGQTLQPADGTSRSSRRCGSPGRPVATGRTSLGGITAAITSDSSGS